MFDIGWSEILIVAIVAVAILGPKDFLQMMRMVGKYLNAAKRTVAELHRHIDDVGRETEIAEINAMRTDFENVQKTVRESVDNVFTPVSTSHTTANEKKTVSKNSKNNPLKKKTQSTREKDALSPPKKKLKKEMKNKIS